jgi:hypothetical protein
MRLVGNVYCTATIDSASNATGYARQQIFLKAIKASGSVDHIEYGISSPG